MPVSTLHLLRGSCHATLAETEAYQRKKPRFLGRDFGGLLVVNRLSVFDDESQSAS